MVSYRWGQGERRRDGGGGGGGSTAGEAEGRAGEKRREVGGAGRNKYNNFNMSYSLQIYNRTIEMKNMNIVEIQILYF